MAGYYQAVGSGWCFARAEWWMRSGPGACEALLIVLDNFEHDVVVASHAAWNGVGAPRNTPVEIIDKLNSEINAALGDTNVRSRQHGVSRLSS